MSLQMFYTTITYHATCFVMDWMLMSATQAAGLGGLVNTEAMAETMPVNRITCRPCRLWST